MIKHLSYSSIDTYQLCPRAWWHRYIQRLDRPAAPALVFGTAFHSVVQQAVVAGDAPAAYWHDHWNEAKDRYSEIDFSSDSEADLLETGDRMLSDPEILDSIAQTTVMTGLDGAPLIETRFEMHVPEVPVPVIGFIDIIEADGVPCDLKTANKPWRKDRADSALQATIYLAALEELGYDLNPERRFRYRVFTKQAKPQAQTLETSRDDADLAGMRRQVVEVWRGIEAGSFWENTRTWKCNPKWCDAWTVCEAGRIPREEL